MKNTTFLLLILFHVLYISQAQERKIPIDTAVVSTHEITIKGKKISYSAEAGTQPVWGSDDKVAATLFYTYYQRTDIKDKAHRPLIISFNGGPGSASVWMNIGYTGP